jgi:hypothetical protein
MKHKLAAHLHIMLTYLHALCTSSWSEDREHEYLNLIVPVHLVTIDPLKADFNFVSK